MNFEEEVFKRLKERAEKYIQYCKENHIEIPEETSTEIAVKQYMERLNCGGHALEIYNHLYPNGEKINNYISGLLEKFDFIRLLGDEPLQDDEYLVFYKFFDYEENKERNEGHHFIKVEEDGLVTEKLGHGELQIFDGWHPIYKNSPLVMFAVKKNHEPFFDLHYRFIEVEGGLNFKETVLKAIKEKSNSFPYHSHNFRFKKLPNGGVVVINKDLEVVASVITDGTETSVQVAEGKEDYIENLSGPVKPVIINGKLMNYSEFKKREKKYRKIVVGKLK